MITKQSIELFEVNSRLIKFIKFIRFLVENLKTIEHRMTYC